MISETRREVLGGIVGAVLATPCVVSPALAAPIKFTVPDGAADCHHHIYDPARFAYLPDAIRKPPPATVAEYRKLQKLEGTTRDVIVQPSTYGTDNACLLDALAKMGTNSRGVAVVGARVSDAELKQLDAAGVRGIRIQFGLGNPVSVEEVMPLAKRIAPMGWHIQFNMPQEQLVQMKKLVLNLPVPIIFDHLGRATDAATGAYPIVRRALDSGKGWVKLSGAYLYGKGAAPDYADTSQAARAYVKAAPERCVWGSDWPHPDASAGVVTMPDDSVLLNLLASWVPDTKLRHRVLVENPEVFYGFDPKKRPKSGSAG